MRWNGTGIVRKFGTVLFNGMGLGQNPMSLIPAVPKLTKTLKSFIVQAQAVCCLVYAFNYIVPT
jgi:hypothetical protein